MNRGIRYVLPSLHAFTLKRENPCVTLTKIMHSSFPHLSDLSQNCQHELVGFRVDKKNLYIVTHKKYVKSENFSFVLTFFESKKLNELVYLALKRFPV